jgi:hypothetical protein
MAGSFSRSYPNPKRLKQKMDLIGLEYITIVRIGIHLCTAISQLRLRCPT